LLKIVQQVAHVADDAALKDASISRAGTTTLILF
jgi:hypothetical protein